MISINKIHYSIKFVFCERIERGIKNKFNKKFVVTFITIFSLLFLQLDINAQNLIADSSFENYTDCPENISQLKNLKFWMQVVNHGGSADFFHKCAFESPLVSIPQNYFGYENPASGDGYVGIIISTKQLDNYREYIQTQLMDTLAKGRTYKVSFKYSLGDKSSIIINSVGIFFSNDLISFDKPNLAQNIKVIPQLNLNKELDRTQGWEEVSFNYTAKGGEKYLILGNFLNDFEIIKKNLTNNFLPLSYLYIDDVCVYDTCIRPEISLPADTTLCNNQSLLLNLSTKNSTFLWQNADTNSSYLITKGGKYWVVVTNSCGSSYDSIYVKYSSVPSKLNLGNDTTICTNEFIILKSNINNVNYLWQDGTKDSIFTVSKNGVYSLKVSNFCGESNDSINVKVDEKPFIKLGNDTTLCNDNELQIQLPKKYNYVWQDNWQDTFYNITKTGLYSVTAFNSCGDFKDEIQVSFEDCSCTQYFIPNAFTPQKNGLNDFFYPISNCKPEKFNLVVYDRWGSEVFYTNNYNEKWDGMTGGKYCQSDVYYYVLSYKFSRTADKTIKGNVTLIR
ncbi:MAG: gliding motility-associated C-terminal domain-containing protein [Bacteroidota bacterium]